MNKFDIMFWDGKNKESIEHISLEEAIKEGFIIFEDNVMLPFDKCTIIRKYTGLKDSTGKEIYEGDLIKWNSDEKRGYSISEVKYDVSQQKYIPFINTSSIIIGNIHE